MVFADTNGRALLVYSIPTLRFGEDSIDNLSVEWLAGSKEFVIQLPEDISFPMSLAFKVWPQKPSVTHGKHWFSLDEQPAKSKRGTDSAKGIKV